MATAGGVPLGADGALQAGEAEPFERLVRTVTRSPRFSISFAVANVPIQRARLLDALRRRLAPELPVVGVALERSVAAGATISVLDELAAAPEAQHPAGRQVLCAWGIEQGLRDEQRAMHLLGGLNRERERFPQRIAGPLVLWLPEFALERLAREAPDFFAWRSGVFTFPLELPVMQSGPRDLWAPPDLANATAEEKRRRIAYNEQLAKALAQGQSGEPGRDSEAGRAGQERLGRIAEVQLEIGHLHRLLGEMNQAAAAYQAAEHLANAAGDTGRMLVAAQATADVSGVKSSALPADVKGASPERRSGRSRPTGAGRADAQRPLDLVVRVAALQGARVAIHVNGSFSHDARLDGFTAPSRPAGGDQDGALRTLGGQLFNTLFPADTPAAATYERFRVAASSQRNRIVLELAGAAAARVPWEYSRDPDRGLLCLRHALLRRARPPRPDAGRDASPRAQSPAGPARVLVVQSDPLLGPGTSRVVPARINVAGETEALIDALRRTGRRYALRRVIPPTIKTLQQDLARQGTAILHFNGHGGLAPDPVLCFEDETGRLDPVGAAGLEVRLAGQVWLIVLSACFSAAMPDDGGVDGVAMAHALSDVGVPWVVGMQDAVGVDDARTFAELFYRYLGEGHPVWEAVRQARVAQPGDWAAGLPVLYAAGAADELARLPVQPAGPLHDETAAERALLGWTEDLSALRAATHFVGREHELVQLGELLAAGARLITLRGPGGIGKSALAHQAALRFGWRFPDGAFSLSLAAASVAPAISPLAQLGTRMLGPRFGELSPDAQQDSLINAVRSSACLVVIDNAEDAVWSREVAPEAARALRALRRASGGRGVLLVTSQQRLGWAGEREVDVRGLTPEAARALAGTFLPDATRLGRQDEAALAAVLQRLDYHPLSIRLFFPAWRASGKSLAQLERDVEALVAGSEDRAPDQDRHRSLDAVFSYAYTSLEGANRDDRTPLCRLSLFRAPFLAGIAAAALDIDAATLRRLTDRSFLWEQTGSAGQAGLFGFQPQVRPFVERRIKEEARDLSADRRRSALVHAVFIREAQAAAGTDRWEDLRALVGLTLPDLYQALEWLDDTERAATAYTLAQALRSLGAYDEAMRLYRESLAIKERLGDQQGQSATLLAMANIHTVRGELDEAMRLYHESLAIKERLGDQQGRGATLAMLGQLLVERGELARGLAALLEALQGLRRLGSSEVATVLAILAAVRGAAGEAQFRAAWQEVTGQADIPDWVPRPAAA